MVPAVELNGITVHSAMIKSSGIMCEFSFGIPQRQQPDIQWQRKKEEESLRKQLRVKVVDNVVSAMTRRNGNTTQTNTVTALWHSFLSIDRPRASNNVQNKMFLVCANVRVVVAKFV